jgi:hypothetical protein
MLQKKNPIKNIAKRSAISSMPSPLNFTPPTPFKLYLQFKKYWRKHPFMTGRWCGGFESASRNGVVDGALVFRTRIGHADAVL